jgi:hypothetical protein
MVCGIVRSTTCPNSERIMEPFCCPPEWINWSYASSEVTECGDMVGE